MNYRNTKQRTILLELLKNTTSHPTALTLYDQAKELLPNISLGTVYRNLAILTEQGLIQRLDCGEASDRYDANTAPHIHFSCEKCEKVYDIHDDFAHEQLETIIDNLNFTVNSHSLMCFGTCHECQE